MDSGHKALAACEINYWLSMKGYFFGQRELTINVLTFLKKELGQAIEACSPLTIWNLLANERNT